MKEQDREYVEDIAKQMGQMPDTFDASVVIKLWGLIDRLDRQLTEIVEAGKPFKEFASCLKKTHNPASTICTTSGESGWATLRNFQISRLAQALKEVKDESA